MLIGFRGGCIMTCDDIRKATTLVEQEDDILVHQLTRLEAALAHTTAEADEARVVEVLQQLCDFFLRDLMQHLAEEEQHFIPAVADLPGGTWKATRVHQEHQQLRRTVEEFRSVMALASDVGPQTRRTLLRELLSGAKSILEQLRTHAAFEYELVSELKELVNPPINANAPVPASTLERFSDRDLI
jgi:iron-sulfur cluster repair protein YtfE (RIC family)